MSNTVFRTDVNGGYTGRLTDMEHREDESVLDDVAEQDGLGEVDAGKAYQEMIAGKARRRAAMRGDAARRKPEGQSPVEFQNENRARERAAGQSQTSPAPDFVASNAPTDGPFGDEDSEATSDPSPPVARDPNARVKARRDREARQRIARGDSR